MSLCLSASVEPTLPAATGRWTALGVQFRRMILGLAEPEDRGDLMPAPSVERMAALRPRRAPANALVLESGGEVNALLL